MVNFCIFFYDRGNLFHSNINYYLEIIHQFITGILYPYVYHFQLFSVYFTGNIFLGRMDIFCKKIISWLWSTSQISAVNFFYNIFFIMYYVWTYYFWNNSGSWFEVRKFWYCSLKKRKKGFIKHNFSFCQF